MISVIIPTLNEEKFLPACLMALCECRERDYEVVVVDNCSTDGTRRVAGALGCRVMVEKAEGVGLARNVGAKNAKGEVVAFLDADSMPCRNWLDIVARELGSGKTAGVGGPTSYGKLRYALSDFPFWLNPVTKQLGFHYFSGNNSAYKKDFFISQGGFRNIYCEDTEFSRRLCRHYQSMRYVPEMKVLLSPRRFEKLGFLNTQLRWLAADIGILMGRHMPCGGYGRRIKA